MKKEKELKLLIRILTNRIWKEQWTEWKGYWVSVCGKVKVALSEMNLGMQLQSKGWVSVSEKEAIDEG